VVFCLYELIGGVFAWLCNIERLSTVHLPDDSVTTSIALWLCSCGAAPRALEPIVRHNAIDGLLAKATGIDLKSLANTQDHVSVNTSSSSHPRNADIAMNAREWLNAARCLKVYNGSCAAKGIKMLQWCFPNALIHNRESYTRWFSAPCSRPCLSRSSRTAD
jgi:hypothetical protein